MAWIAYRVAEVGMARQSKAEKAIDKRISDAFNAVGKGVEIPLMDIPKIHAKGKEAIAQGANDEALRQVISDFLQTIRKN